MRCRGIKTFLAAVSIMTFLAGCGGNTEGSMPSAATESKSAENTQSTGVSKPNGSLTGTETVTTNTPGIFDGTGTIKMDSAFTAKATGVPTQCGAQFYQNEAVELWRKPNSGSASEAAQSLYLFNEEGNGILMIKNIPAECKGMWYLTEDGYLLTYVKNQLTRIEEDGTVTYATNVESGIQDICRLSDGRILMLVLSVEGNLSIAELTPETGEYVLIGEDNLGKDKKQYIAAEGAELVLLNKDGFFQVNLENGELSSIMPMTEYDYDLGFTLKDFKLVGGGCAKMLFLGSEEVLQPIEAEKYRTVITLKSLYGSGWLANLIESFNQSNYAYYVQMDSMSYNSSVSARKTFLEETEAELLAGGGPDILTGDFVDSTIESVKGKLLNLVPYMESGGVYEEDYFYSTFESWRDGDEIYGANIWLNCSGLKVKKEFLPEGEIPDIESFVEELLNYSGTTVFRDNCSADSILSYLFGASDSFFGMVDWEKGSCNFETMLFENILEVAKLYADDGESSLPALGAYINNGWYKFERSEELELQEEIYLGYFFDEGNYTLANSNCLLGINRNSANKEGAWEFIRYALSEKYQTQKEQDSKNFLIRSMPVNRAAFEAVSQLEYEEGVIVKTIYDGGSSVFYKLGRDSSMSNEEFCAIHNLTEADLEELMVMAENARCAPLRASTVKNMIRDEAEAFFNGEKSAEEVGIVVQAKVQAFLDEYCK